jgi:UDP-N-acetylmuramyl pentapeptide phosphotransferase/UDP-N-acetylglucosamine-1-phosphate transferase
MIITVLAAFVVALAATGALTRAEGWLRIMDRPNERSLHTRPTPRTGGLAICLASAIGLTLSALFGWGARAELAWIAATALIVGVVSFIDDRTPLPARTRLLVQLAGAGLIALGGLMPDAIAWPGGELVLSLQWLGVTLWILFTVWMVNLYNFMDGMDGLAGGMAVFGFGTLGGLGLLAGDPGYAGICWVIAASAAGFLVWNFPPARIFMGDAGSSTLGLMAAALGLWADARDLFPVWIAVLVFFPFFFDATVTLLRRLLQGQRVWEAHRTHYYQRLVQTGWTHRRTALWEYAGMAICAAGAVSAQRASATVQFLIIAFIVALHVGAAVAVNFMERRRGESLTEKSVR